MAEHIDMSVAKQGEACDIFIIQCFTLRPEMIGGCLHIIVFHNTTALVTSPRCAQLIFLTVGISFFLSHLLTVTDGSGSGMATFSRLSWVRMRRR